MSTVTKIRRLSPKARKPNGSRTSPGEVRALRRRFGLSQVLLARLLDASLRSVSAAETQGVVPSAMRRNLTQIGRLCQALAGAMQPAYAGAWLDQPNDMLGGLKPVEAVERGQFDLVWQVVAGLESGSLL